MNPEDARVLQALLEEQERLHSRVSELDRKIAEFQAKVAMKTEPAPAAKVMEGWEQPPRETRIETTPVVPETAALEKAEVLIPPPLPPRAGVAAARAESKASATGAPVPPPVPPAPDAPAKDTWEVQLGTVWFARIGIVVLITGLVFLGNYAWQHVVAQLGAGGKLSLLVLAGAVLAGLGRWLEGRAEATRNYGRVLIAGGAATIYYSAYAAHFVRPLKVIESPMIGGALLLVIAGLFIAWADRQRSQVVAVLTIVLAYYTSAINPIGNFTLFSSLLLTAGAVWLLLRHDWETLGWASLAGTYGSFAYWRIVHPGRGTHWGTGVAFLLGYWTLFTGAVLLRGAEKISEERRAAFLTVNNAAFFALAAWRFLTWEPRAFGWFSMAFGAVLLGIALIARRRLPTQPLVEQAYLVQGLLLVTVGVMAKFTGSQLALLLAAESAILIGAARWRHGKIFHVFSLLSGAGAWAAAWLHGGNRVPTGVGAVLIFNAWWLRAQLPHLRERIVDFRAALFVAGGISLFVPALMLTVAPPYLPLAWAAMALLGTASVYGLRVPELVLGTHVVLAIGIFQLYTESHPATLLRALPLFAAAFGLSHWWQHQKALNLAPDGSRALQLAWAVGGVIAGVAWLRDSTAGNTWLLATSASALGLMIYGLLTRSWAIPVASQIFTVLAVGAFLLGIVFASPVWYATLAPVLVVAFTSILLLHAGRWIPAGDAADIAGAAAKVYRITASVLFAIWIWEYASPAWRPFAYVAAGGVILLASRFLSPSAPFLGSAYLIFGLLAYILMNWSAASWPHLAAIIAAPLALRIGLRTNPAAAGAYPVHLRHLIMALAVAALWFWTTRWTLLHHGSTGLTVAWSILALLVFGTGLALQERVYRLGGFAFLALAVGKVFLVDVWRLETLHRILSFLVLGVVLLVLGFVYNKYADRIRRLL